MGTEEEYYKLLKDIKNDTDYLELQKQQFKQELLNLLEAEKEEETKYAPVIKRNFWQRLIYLFKGD